MRNIVVKYVRDAVDIQTACSHIRGHQDVQTPVLQLIHGTLTLHLRDVSVDGSCVETSSSQAFRELLGLILRADEHYHRLELRDLEDAGQGVQLVAVIDEQIILLDVLGCALSCLNSDLNRLVQVLLGQPADAIGHRRGKQSNLLILRRIGQNALNVLLEAHVEHLISFIENHET